MGTDCAAVVAYGALIPPALLDLPARGWINLHFVASRRGAAPVPSRRPSQPVTPSPGPARSRSRPDSTPARCNGTLTTDIGAGETSGDLLDRL